MPEDTKWRRLDRRMLFVHPVNELIRFLPALIVLFLFRQSGDGDELWHLLPVVIVVGIGVLRYVTTSFRITPEQIQLRKGLVSRHILSARLDRVRTVDLTSSPIHRLLGLSKVVVGTGSASSKRDESLSLDALGTQEARGLRAELLHHRAVPVPDHGPAVRAPLGDGRTGPLGDGRTGPLGDSRTESMGDSRSGSTAADADAGTARAPGGAGSAGVPAGAAAYDRRSGAEQEAAAGPGTGAPGQRDHATPAGAAAGGDGTALESVATVQRHGPGADAVPASGG
ncbi:PH domain-containing protein, partial [Nostocoides japonicum]|uniref:PH domain-containing protein n=1 Tax=Nostocoides japonicum TaxID=99481 RepID=UPI00138EE5D9